jgi:hypothetical protein
VISLGGADTLLYAAVNPDGRPVLLKTYTSFTISRYSRFFYVILVIAEEASGYFAQHPTQTSEVLLSFPRGVNYNEVMALCSNKFIDKFVAVGYNEVHRKE